MVAIEATNCHVVNVNKHKKDNFSFFFFDIQTVVSK